MVKKKCSIGSIENFEYEEGSFADIVHQYIEASTKADLDKIKNEIQSKRLRELLYWSEGLLTEFSRHFKERFRDVIINSDAWHLEIDKWNWMGIILGQLQAFKWSEEIYRALYELLCNLQISKNERISKGTPLHQIGWVDLLRGTPESIKRSQYYMKLAMIEDILTDNKKYKELPAYRVLIGEHNLSEENLNRLVQNVAAYKKEHCKDPCFRPELIYMEYVIDRKNKERSSLYDLDHKLADQLMENVNQATESHKKGLSLEILMAYLFLTAPGFEVLRNLVSFDMQNDLLARNLHTGDPMLSELGKYILIECKNIERKIDAKTIRDFATKVIQTSCKSGIIVTKEGITGDSNSQSIHDARLTLLKFHQRHEVIIIPLTITQIKQVINKQVSLIDMLIYEYEEIKFDLP